VNPLAGFSLGNIIKSLIPGLIAAAALWLLFELAFHSSLDVSDKPTGSVSAAYWMNSLAASVTRDTTRTTLLGLLLLPVSLMLGFFLNTIVWLVANGPLRALVKRNLSDSETVLLEKLTVLSHYVAELYGIDASRWNPHLPSLFLPVLDLAKVAHIHNSYFSWYEFQINSALATLLLAGSCIATACFLETQWQLPFVAAFEFFPMPVALLLGLLFVSLAVMVISAYRNLKCHEERLIWLMAGSLYFVHTMKADKGTTG
jgi:hypothetical protein